VTESGAGIPACSRLSGGFFGTLRRGRLQRPEYRRDRDGQKTHRPRDSQRSKRSGRAFVSVNCAALPPSLISSELFGHEKGAFTGATQRRLGRFELADGGTIFLDEVGELPPDTQLARLGGGRPIKVDVRLIAATNRDLAAATADGTFRLDLFYQLNIFPIEVAASSRAEGRRLDVAGIFRQALRQPRREGYPID